MSTWIAFFRGIGGNIRPLPMEELKAELEQLGLTNVQTYIATGNVVFEAPRTSAAKLMRDISERVTARFGFDAKALVLTVAELEQAVAANPFPQADDDPPSLHLFFLWQAARDADLAAMDALKRGREAFALRQKVFYLYAPDGIATSKLAAKLGRLLKVECTARNWRTANKVLALAKARTKPAVRSREAGSPARAARGRSARRPRPAC